MSAPAIMLPITLTMAGAATLLNLWLGQRVGKMRLAHKVSIGDGGHEPLITRMRAQANYVEYTPFFLILLALIELATGPQLWLWIVAIVFILGRIVCNRPIRWEGWAEGKRPGFGGICRDISGWKWRFSATLRPCDQPILYLKSFLA